MMAFTTFLMTVSLVAIASGANYGHFFLAGFPGWSDDDNAFTGFNSPMMSLRFSAPPMPPMPTLPGMPKFPAFPSPSSFLFNAFPAMVTMPPFPPMPSIQDIANAQPSNGGTYNGVVVSTQSESKRNNDGTVSKTGESTIVINNDGKLIVKKFGNTSPTTTTVSPVPVPFFDFVAPKVNNMNIQKIRPYKPFEFQPIRFNHFGFSFPTIPPIDPETIKKHVPKAGEQYSGQVVSSHISISNNNGVKTGEASISSVDNDNGVVKEKKTVINLDGTTL